MSISYQYHVPTDLLGERKSVEAGSKLNKIWQRFETAQMRRAERLVLETIQRLDDETLLMSGYSIEDIALLRAGEFVRLKI